MHADEVVGVHDSVDESIQYNCEVYISIVLWVSIQPVEQKDGEMMIYVKEWKLTPFLSKNDEDGIPKVPNLGCCVDFESDYIMCEFILFSFTVCRVHGI